MSNELAIVIHDSELLSPADAARLHGQYANRADYTRGPFDQDCTVFASNAPGGLAAKLVTQCLNTPKETVELLSTVEGKLTNRGLGAPPMNRQRADGTYGFTKDVPKSIQVQGATATSWVFSTRRHAMIAERQGGHCEDLTS